MHIVDLKCNMSTRDIIQLLSEAGDLGTVLALTKSLPQLARFQRDDPEGYWKMVFNRLFPEYQWLMDKLETEAQRQEDRNLQYRTAIFYKNFSFWLAYLHRRVLKNIARASSGEITLIQTEGSTSGGALYFRGELYSIRDYAQMLSGQPCLLGVFASLYGPPINRTEMPTLENRQIAAFQWRFIGQMFPITGSGVTLRNQATENFFGNFDNALYIDIFLVFQNISLILKRFGDKIDSRNTLVRIIAEGIPEAPNAQNELVPYLGCEMCDKEATVKCSDCNSHYCGEACFIKSDSCLKN